MNPSMINLYKAPHFKPSSGNKTVSSDLIENPISKIWTRYKNLSLSLKLYLGLSTILVCYFGDKISSDIYERSRLNQEAQKEVDIETSALKRV
ncbi:hypothetical protein PACTADRAFT_51179, partial [Pachysolen tannophilus NRRL Y-2460]